LWNTEKFTTADLNVNFGTRYHLDQNDWRIRIDGKEKGGYSVIKVLKDKRKVAGGILVLPQYKVGVDLEDGDAIWMQILEASSCKHQNLSRSSP
jgi:hypothetical protein